LATTRVQDAAKTRVGNLSLQGTARHPQARTVAPKRPTLPVRIIGLEFLNAREDVWADYCHVLVCANELLCLDRKKPSNASEPVNSLSLPGSGRHLGM
jgi:hypothetical protein